MQRVAWTIHDETCRVCGKPANPGLSVTYTTHFGQQQRSWCSEHIPEKEARYIKGQKKIWAKVLQTPPGA